MVAASIFSFSPCSALSSWRSVFTLATSLPPWSGLSFNSGSVAPWSMSPIGAEASFVVWSALLVGVVDARALDVLAASSAAASVAATAAAAAAAAATACGFWGAGAVVEAGKSATTASSLIICRGKLRSWAGAACRGSLKSVRVWDTVQNLDAPYTRLACRSSHTPCLGESFMDNNVSQMIKTLLLWTFASFKHLASPS